MKAEQIPAATQLANPADVDIPAMETVEADVEGVVLVEAAVATGPIDAADVRAEVSGMSLSHQAEPK